MRYIIAIACILAASSALAEIEQSILNPSGLPIPRFVSLKSDDVNLRVGPGKRYPIRWVYHRQHLPVQIIEEFAHWRKIQDFDGTSGWVHKGMVDGKRTAMVMDKPQNLYSRPDATSTIVMRAEKGVIGNVKECQPDWCRLDIENRKGWIRKSDIFGVNREEVFSE